MAGKERTYLLGIDLGAGSLKATVIDQTGNLMTAIEFAKKQAGFEQSYA